jgi:predicted DNA-binding transcriptional regulator AlpA
MVPYQVQRRTLLPTPAAAAYCGLGKSSLDKLRISGGGPVYLKIGRRVLYDLADLDQWLGAHRRASTSERRREQSARVAEVLA